MENLPGETLEDLYEHAPCGYLSSLGDGTIVRVNQTFLDWTGYAREALVGERRFQDLLTPGGQIYHETHYAPLLRMQGAVREIALTIRCADGRRLPVLINSTLRGEVVRTMVFDARDRRAYEDELLAARRRETEERERTERLQRLSSVLAAATDEREVAAAALDAVVEFMGAAGGCVETAAAGELCTRGGAAAAHTETIELAGAGGRLGELRLDFAEPHELTEAERAFLDACARQCAQALERAHLYVQTHAAAQRTAFLAELARRLEAERTFAARAQVLVDMLVPSLAAHARVEAEDRVVAERTAPGGRGERRLDVPLRGRDGEIGRVVVEGSGGLDALTLDDLADRAALALENARLYEHEREVAAALQRSMLTARFPVDPRFLVEAHYQPAMEDMEVGGDWYDAFVTGGGRLAIVVGDVVGRGIGAASAMGQLRSAVRALAAAVEGPAEVLARLDDFVEHVDVARSATLVYADLDPGTGVLRYACAGHPPPVLAPPGGQPDLLWGGRSAPLGATVGVAAMRRHAEVRLAPGSRVVLYTDGLVERRDRSIDAGLDALLAAIGDRTEASLAAVVGELPARLEAGDGHRDDICVLGLDFGAGTFELCCGHDARTAENHRAGGRRDRPGAARAVAAGPRPLGPAGRRRARALRPLAR